MQKEEKFLGLRKSRAKPFRRRRRKNRQQIVKLTESLRKIMIRCKGSLRTTVIAVILNMYIMIMKTGALTMWKVKWAFEKITSQEEILEDLTLEISTKMQDLSYLGHVVSVTN